MRLFRIFGAVLCFGLGVLLFIPLAVAAWLLLLSPGHRETFASVIVAGHELTGGHMWSFVGSQAFIGAMLILFGIYVLHSRQSAA